MIELSIPKYISILKTFLQHTFRKFRLYPQKSKVILKLFYDVELIKSFYANNFTSLGAVVFLIVDISVELKHVFTVLNQDFLESSLLG